MFLNHVAQHRANIALHALGLTYHDGVPLDKLMDAIETNGWTVADHERPMLVCGHEGKTTVACWFMSKERMAAADAYERLTTNKMDVPSTRRCLFFTWYRMPSGRYEIVAYLS